MADSDEEEVKDNESSDYEDDVAAAPAAKRQRTTSGAKSTKKGRRKTAKGKEKDDSAGADHLAGRKIQKDAFPPIRALEHIASFVNDLDTLAALSSTCKDLRYHLVHAPGAWQRWHAVLGRYKPMTQGDAAVTFALPPRLLKRCPYRIEIRTKRSPIGKYNYERHMFNLQPVFKEALQPRRQRKGVASNERRMSELFRAREERERRRAAAERAKETKAFRGRYIAGIEFSMQGFREMQGDVAHHCPRMRSLLQKRIEELDARIDEADQAKDPKLAQEIRDGEHMKEAEQLSKVMHSISSAKKVTEAWVWEGSSEASNIKVKLDSLLDKCKGLKAWKDVEQVASAAREEADALSKAHHQRRQEVRSEACAPFEKILAEAREEDRALTPDQRDDKITDALERAGCHPHPPNSGLLRAYVQWSFFGGELCWMEIVGVREAVDILASDGMLRWLPGNLSGRIHRRLVDLALEKYRNEKKPWEPTRDELRKTIQQLGADEGNSVSFAVECALRDREDPDCIF